MEKLEKKFKALRAQGVLDGSAAGATVADKGVERADVVGGMTHPQPQRVMRGRLYAGDMERTSMSTGGGAAYQQPISKDDLRDIIREEVRQGLNIKEEAKHMRLHSELDLHIDRVTADRDADGRPLAATGGWKAATEEDRKKEPLSQGYSSKGSPVASFSRGEAKQRASMKNMQTMQAGSEVASIRSTTLESSKADGWIGVSNDVHRPALGGAFVSMYSDKQPSNVSSPSAQSPMLQSTRARQIEQLMEPPAVAMSDFDLNVLAEGQKSLVGAHLLASGKTYEGIQFSRSNSSESATNQKDQSYKEVSDNAKRAWEKLRGMKGNLVALLYEASKADRKVGPGMLTRGKSMGKRNSYHEEDPLGVGAKSGQLNAAQREIMEQSERFKEKYLLNPRTIDDTVEYSLG